MLEGFSLGNYLLLVDYTGRLFREGKAAISGEVAEIMQRLGTAAETWQVRLEKATVPPPASKRSQPKLDPVYLQAQVSAPGS